jgi:nucleotide-binding universal stress UspA family protein
MYQRILVPIDGSATSQRGLEEAIDLAKLTQGRLRLYHSLDELSLALAMDAYSIRPGEWIGELRRDGQRLLDEAKAAANAAGVEAETVLHERYSGQVHQQVLAEAEQWGADLIVIGTHGRRGIDRFVMGSSAEQILRQARVPVLLVRTPSAADEDEAKDAPEHEKVSLPSSALSFE